jgi:hypothetical protein
MKKNSIVNYNQVSEMLSKKPRVLERIFTLIPP